MVRGSGGRSGSRLSVAALLLLLGGCQNAVSPTPSGALSEAGTPAPVASGPAATAAPPTVDIADSSYRPAGGRNGGSVVIGAITEANAFQPYFAAEQIDRDVAAAAWSTLVRVAPDGRYLADLATTVPTTGNGAVTAPGAGGDAMTVVWQLRDGLEWSDGEPLTCDDVRYAWQWVLDPQNVGVDRSGFEDIGDIECRSATDMVWHFRRVYEAYLTLLPTPLPRHYLAAIPIADQLSGTGTAPADLPKLPVSGPFRFGSVAPGSEIRMTANPKWSNPIGGGKAHLASIVWRWYPDAAALAAAFKSGRVDVATGLRAGQVPADKAITARAVTTPSLDAMTLVLNWSRPPDPGSSERPPPVCSRNVLVAGRGAGCPTSDAALRAGIARAIDKDAIVSEILHGTAAVTDSAVPSAAWFATSEGPPATGPDAAAAALDGGGWRAGPDGTRAKDGLAATIEICGLNDQVGSALMTRISADLNAVGIAVVPHLATLDELDADPTDEAAPPACSLSGGNFDAALVPVTSPIDPLGFFFAYDSSQISPDGTNVGAVHDPTIDAALETVATSVEPGTIQAAMSSFQAAYRDTTAAVPLYRTTSVDLVGAKIGNVAANPLLQSPVWNVADWFRKR